MGRKQFDPRPFLPLPASINVVPTHGESWQNKWANWWAGGTIASPTIHVAAPAKQSLKAVYRFLDNIDRLNSHFESETEYARYWVRQVLRLQENVPVILDASGTSAILMATRMLAHVAASDKNIKTFFTITTSEGGSLVPYTLRGKDPNDAETVMFQPTSMLFYEPEPVLPYPANIELKASPTVNIAKNDNASIVEEIRRQVESLSDGTGTAVGCIMLPHVCKTGRLLPVREVSKLVDELRAKGHKLYYVVDAVQSIGRTDAESITDPLAWCDAFLFGASKALGGLLIASAVVMKEELVERFFTLCQEAGKGNGIDCAQAPSISHFQFEPRFEEMLPDAMMKRGAVALPEIVGMRAALQNHFQRGRGESYSERRKKQMQKIWKLRAKLISALTKVDGVEILDATPERPLVPSIVCFRVAKPGLSAMGLKKALQEGAPIVTPTQPINNYLRLDIPEYRRMPSPDVLVAKLEQVLAGK